MMKQSGFTLIEMMVVLAIAVILTTSAVPSFQTFIQNNRLSTASHQFITSLNLARSEAVKRGKRVTVCKISNSTACTTSNGWEQGWIIFVDEDGNGARDAGTDELLRVQVALAGIDSIDGQTHVANLISYADSGFPQLVTGGSLSPQLSTLVICDSRDFGSHAKALVVNTTGSVRTTSATDSGLNAGVTSCNV